MLRLFHTSSLLTSSLLTPLTLLAQHPDTVQLHPVVVRFDEAIRMCLTGEIKDAKTITSLLLWERLRGERPE